MAPVVSLGLSHLMVHEFSIYIWRKLVVFFFLCIRQVSLSLHPLFGNTELFCNLCLCLYETTLICGTSLCSSSGTQWSIGMSPSGMSFRRAVGHSRSTMLCYETELIRSASDWPFHFQSRLILSCSSWDHLRDSEKPRKELWDQKTLLLSQSLGQFPAISATNRQHVSRCSSKMTRW